MEGYFDILKQLYDHLRTNYIRMANVKAPNNKYESLYLAIFHAKSKTRRMRILQEAAIPAAAIPGPILEQLEKLRFIDLIEKRTKVTLSSRGLWTAENMLQIIDSDKLIDYIDEEFFNCFVEQQQSLDNREKVVLFTALAARAFSEESAIDVKDHRYHDDWMAIVRLVYDTLCENKIIMKDFKIEELFGHRQTSLHSIINFFRYSEKLPKKTNGIYLAKSNKYYLNMYRNNKIDISELVFLFHLIFADKLNYELIQKINDFCTMLAYNVGVKIFDINKHRFANPDYDNMIYDSLRKTMLV